MPTMYQASVPVFLHMLNATSGLLDKAAAHVTARKIAPDALLTARLFPDMYTFTKQVQIACDFAKATVSRLAGMEIPKYEDSEKSFDELKARIAKTVDFLKTFQPAQIDGTEDNTITFPTGGQTMTLTGEKYLTLFALPNFYFHLTTAYAILRHNGIELGKRDFMGRP
jgi:hypothetical protein